MSTKVMWNDEEYSSITKLARRKGFKYERMQRILNVLNIHSDSELDAYLAKKKGKKLGRTLRQMFPSLHRKERKVSLKRQHGPNEEFGKDRKHYQGFIRWLEEVGQP